MRSKSQTRKSGVANYTSPEFLEELKIKTESYYFDAPQVSCRIDGKRRSKFIVEDPIFLAIKELRHRGKLEEFIRLADARPKSDYRDADTETKLASTLLEDTILKIRIELAAPLNPEFRRTVGRFVTEAIKDGNFKALKDFFYKCTLFDTKDNPPRERRSDPKRWHYYAGRAALHFLEQGIIPTKGEVKDQSLVERAQGELPIDSRTVSQRWRRIGNKVDQMRGLRPHARTWTRIFNDLGLSELPASSTH
jgi:hypothetical protein